MAKFTDYIKAFEEDDENSEGTGVIILERFICSGFGTDGNYGRITLSIGVSATGSTDSIGKVTLPKFTVYGREGSVGNIVLPKLQVSATRILSGEGFIALKIFDLIGSGLEQGRGIADVSLPVFEVSGWAGPAIKIFDLCQDNNWGF